MFRGTQFALLVLSVFLLKTNFVQAQIEVPDYVIEDGEVLEWQGSSFNAEDSIVIKSGGYLTISSSTIAFRDQKQIIIEEGGRLFIRNGTVLQGLNGARWFGIVVLGNNTVPYPVSQGSHCITGECSNHGLLVMRSTTIKDTKTAIHAKNSGETTYAGAGIIDVGNSIFINNENDITISHRRSATEKSLSKVINSKFSLTSLGNFDATLGHGFQSSRMLLLYTPGVVVENNQFTVGLPSAVHQEGVTAITVCGSGPKIGSDCPVGGNKFFNFYKGIDIYNDISLSYPTFIGSNTFTNIAKSITLNGSLMATIRTNTIEVPTLLDIDNVFRPSYGIFVENSIGTIIENNAIEYTGFAIGSNNKSRGIVVKNSNLAGVNGNEILGNIFSGQFNGATAFEENNTGIIVNYNDYPFQTLGWYFPECSDCGLPNWGSCNLNSKEGSSKNVWTPSSVVQILNNSSSTLQMRVSERPLFFPTNYYIPANTQNVNVEVCEEVNISESIVYNCANDIVGSINTPVDIVVPTGPIGIYTELMDELRKEVNLGDLEKAKKLLEDTRTPWGDKILTATYIREGNPKASQFLETLPTNTVGNQNFQRLFQGLHKMHINNDIQTEKATETVIRQEIVTSSHQPTAKLAESALAMNWGDRFDRIPAPVIFPKVLQKSVELEKEITLSPNPASNQLTIGWNIESSIGKVLIYDNLGRLQKQFFAEKNATVLQINTVDMPTGMYICKLLDRDNQVFATQKIMIVK